jgi:hypothetical protein
MPHAPQVDCPGVADIDSICGEIESTCSRARAPVPQEVFEHTAARERFLDFLAAYELRGK